MPVYATLPLQNSDLHTGGIVNATNFTTLFTVTDTKAGDVITDHNNDG